MVGLVENALIEIKEKYRPDRIIIESRWVPLENACLLLPAAAALWDQAGV